MEKAFEKIIKRLVDRKMEWLNFFMTDPEYVEHRINALNGAICIVKEVAEESENDRCKWYYRYSDEENIFDTDCGEGFYFESGGVGEDGFKYCPYCGRLIKVMDDEQDE